ncbi:MAG: zinc finger domain-containing protein [Terrimicrobiaceae bacterium]
MAAAKISSARCERCWRHRGEVGASSAHPTLCLRCEEAVVAMGHCSDEA